jgi:hypothetical protein
VVNQTGLGGPLDDDLEAMTHEQLVAEVRRLRAGIRAHGDSTGHELCWRHPAIWLLLPERTDPLPSMFTDRAVYRRFCVVPAGQPVDLAQPCLLLDHGRQPVRRPPGLIP